MFQSNPNQRRIVISGKEKCDTDHVYARINKKAILEAMRNLTPTQFEVWLYLSSQNNGYDFAFSPAAVSKETGIAKSSLQAGIRKLIEQNYLIKRKDNSNIFDFYQIPKDNTEQVLNIHINKNIDNGFVF